jgi:hypothetical protein
MSLPSRWHICFWSRAKNFIFISWHIFSIYVWSSFVGFVITLILIKISWNLSIVFGLLKYALVHSTASSHSLIYHLIYAVLFSVKSGRWCILSSCVLCSRILASCSWSAITSRHVKVFHKSPAQFARLNHFLALSHPRLFNWPKAIFHRISNKDYTRCIVFVSENANFVYKKLPLVITMNPTAHAARTKRMMKT